MAPGRWFVYVLACRDGTLYTGITTNVERRLAAHQAGRGARYTRGRGPLALVFVEPVDSRRQALRREFAIKSLPRRKKPGAGANLLRRASRRA